MNKYINILNNLYEYCRNTDKIERIRNRNTDDDRLIISYDEVYTENHHIVPRSLGGTNDNNNLVYLLPEEHLFVHKLRWKIYENINDMLAVRFMINGFNGNTFKKSKCMSITRKIKNSYSFMKQNSYLVRINGGWQTEDGRKRISEARKGTMPVIDAKTREMIGSVDVNHDNVKNGKWVHHTKGMVSVIDKDENIKRISTTEYHDNYDLYKSLNSNVGEDNPKYYDITNEDIINIYHYHIEQIGFIVAYGTLSKILKINGKKILPEIRIGGFRFPKGISHITNNAILKYKDKYIDISGKCIKKEIKQKYLNNKSPKEIIKEYVNELNNKEIK